MNAMWFSFFNGRRGGHGGRVRTMLARLSEGMKRNRCGLSPFAFLSLVAAVAAAFSSPAWGDISAVTKSFVPASIAAGTTSMLTVSITNTPPGNPTSIAFTDNYPAGLTNSATPTTNGNCDANAVAVLTGAVGGSSLALNGGAINGNKTCTITVSVAACTAAGSYTNPIFTVSSSTNSFNSNVATLTVTVGAVSATTSTVVASPTSVAADGTTTSTVTVTLKDCGNNPVSGKTVSLSAGSGSSTITTVSGTTNASGQATFTVKDSVAETVTYTAKDTTDNIAITQTATVTFNTVASSFSFNAFESTTAAGLTTGVIYTKISGSAFGLDVVAISGGAQATGFNGKVKLELLANSTPGLNYGGTNPNCPNTYTIIPFTTIASAAIAGGRTTIAFQAGADVYPDVRVRISYSTTLPTIIVCSTDSFAIRPYSLVINSVTDKDWQTAGVINNLTNLSATTVTPIHKAGQPFTIQVTAQNAVGVTTVNYAGIPNTAIPTACAGTACAAAFGAVVPGTWAANPGPGPNGSVITNTATYSEVGAFALQLEDTTFASVDNADGTPANCAGYYICSSTLSVGRFVPDHFDTIVIPGMPCPTVLTCPTLIVANDQGFVYSGQTFPVNVIARNLASTTTTNYDSVKGLSKAITLTAWDAPGSTTTQNPPSATPGSLGNGVIAAASFSQGSTVSPGTPGTPIYSLPNPYPSATAPPGPTDIYLRATDMDNVTSLRGTSSVEGGIKIASGRVKISNAYGSELLPLTLTASAQYYSASGWVNSSTDSVTSLTFPATYPVGSGTTAVTLTPSSGTLSAGLLTIYLGKPSSGAGVATVNPPVSVALCPIPASCYLTVTPGTATFGVYKGNNNFIYQRESY